MTKTPIISAFTALLIILSLYFLISPTFENFAVTSWKLSSPFHSSSPVTTKDGKQLYLLGAGKGDITGPVAEINLMGYADPNQLGSGLRQRLYSRAFIVGSVEKPEDRFVYLVLDTQSGDTAVRHGILESLAQLGPDYRMYGQNNVAVTGTHSHAGPGAWLNYLLPQITSRGFDKSSYQSIVDGAVESIKQAHERLAPGTLSVADIEIKDANINRSPYAYLANPAEERARYEHDVDKTMTVLRFAHVDGDGDRDIGILTWFPVHGTSMLGNNTLITGDNKGVAARLFETSTKADSFVAGFSQANVGDTSPNVLGAYCESGPQIGQQCDFKTSLCGNKTQPCHGRGPYYGRDDAGTASTFEIGRRQFQGAWGIFGNRSAFTSIGGKLVKSVHRFVDFSQFTFDLANGTTVKTCPAALGYSFAAGTSDGPGAFDFKQAQPGDPHANPLWSLVGNRVHKANDTQKACHSVKPILLDVGESKSPYDWSPNIVDIQLLRVGQLFIIVSPGEATTMAGRRWKETIGKKASEASAQLDVAGEQPIVVLGGPANTYTHYITTPEEYTIQRYEGASTLYGPHTLDAYINLTTSTLRYLGTRGFAVPGFSAGPFPPINTNNSRSFITPVIVDRAGLFHKFGDVTSDVNQTYQLGDTISAKFVGANPRSNHRIGGTFAAVEKYNEDNGSWLQVRDDADWSLVYEWKRTSTVLGTSEVTISWESKWETDAWKKGNLAAGSNSHTDLLLRRDDHEGMYRLRYYGDAKSIGGTITPFEGVSSEFRLTV